MDGFLNIVKPCGPTSHDIVNKIKWFFNKKEKVGHAGTLDPMAEGVLVVAIGKATRAIEYIDSSVKVYDAKLRLGITTDTQDTTGETLEICDASKVSEEMFFSAIKSFVGQIEQVPPMVSAIKYQGQPLYKLAREGKEVPRRARKIEIFDIEADFSSDGDIPLTITCSSGTYIRTLCHDIGLALGCGGAMSALRRTRVGEFSIEDSVAIEDFFAAEDKACMLTDMSFALRNMPRMTLNDANIKRISVGLAVRARGCYTEPICLVNGGGDVVGIGKYDDGLILPSKVFVERN